MPRPSLKAVNGDQSGIPGNRYLSFLADCKVAEGDPFLVIAVSITEPTVPTLAVCEGH